MEKNENSQKKKPLSVKDILLRKKNKTPIIMLTAYDAQTAGILEQAGVDILLVGDSLGNVFQGQDSTRHVTMDHMLYHTETVRRGAPNSLIVADLPYKSYETPEKALLNAQKLMSVGANAVKLEGSPEGTVTHIVSRGIPVMGHVGLLPQTAKDFTVKGKSEDEAGQIRTQAKNLQSEGVFSIVLESVPESLAEELTNNLSIPTIGIGAGKYCNGQVLVINDLIGLSTGKSPKFVKRYADIAKAIETAVCNFQSEVKTGTFPDSGHTYH